MSSVEQLRSFVPMFLRPPVGRPVWEICVSFIHFENLCRPSVYLQLLTKAVFEDGTINGLASGCFAVAKFGIHLGHCRTSTSPG